MSFGSARPGRRAPAGRAASVVWRSRPALTKTLPATDGARVSSTKVDLCTDPSDRPSPRLAVALALIGGLVWCDEFEVAKERRLEREARRAEKRKPIKCWPHRSDLVT
jgi:hypothetical protein